MKNLTTKNEIKDSIFNLKKEIKLHNDLGNKNRVAIAEMRLKKFKDLDNLLNK